MKKEYVLQDLILISKDGEWGKGEPFERSVEMIVIRATDFEDVQIGQHSNIPIRFIPLAIASRKELQENDIIIETAGGGKDRPTGRTQLLRSEFFRKSNLPITCASFCRFIRIDNSKAEPNYVYWLLQHLYKTGVMLQFHTQHTGVARFQYTTFATSLKFQLQEKKTQRKIASILSAYDDLIENNTRRIAILEEMSQRLYKEWFVNFKFPGHETAKFVDSPLGMIPEGWRVKELGSICKEIRRTINPSLIDHDTPYIGLEHLPRKSITLNNWGTAKDVQSSKLLFKKGEILFGKIRPYFHKVGVAPFDGVCSTDAIVIVATKTQLSHF
jgi:type I restriction enzyme S subunit